MQGLMKLPSAVSTLIAHSPEYWERFQLMTHGEQVHAVAYLTTSLLMVGGPATKATRSLASLGSRLETLSLPVLSLSADGALALQRVSVPAGRMATALSGGPGAFYILHMASSGSQPPPPSQGPGKWGPSKETVKSMGSERAARYQQQITGRPIEEAYWVDGVKFDGYKNGVLLEAKGPGYADKFLDTLAPEFWFEHSGAHDLIKQAKRQFDAAKGVPIQWHVAESRAADAIRLLLKRAGHGAIEVIHTPVIPWK
jgi:hypothetical protein